MVPCCDKRFLAVGAGFSQVSFGADSSPEQVPGFKSPAQVWLVPRGVLVNTEAWAHGPGMGGMGQGSDAVLRND